ncbi:TadA family conjugal transfer-associated ATPase [Arthrobacter gengyunqii]|uniref:TadA family conjugal transfer-associated ATPase n=2 Tax=Arthrobacter gengyunqii TaxID=2886940 RepID=A0A9X1M008_9MICC|nr:TadA family conjugal transfer-associated ATPase [Arthrobacter gengyunqii]MCC3265681.1 TadA family conjugal transfer-associated ATPase [Arthrobacter gengyunqii]MCC3268415.1 TadA family conjugal transfer-associated ATPase [Arthrobacter gengyunqii]UOY97915.1 TadA family conjugal transfer-associated ATPase [Arthrobacter gengyunqii]
MVREVRRRMLDDGEPVTAARLAAAVHSSGRLLGAEGALRAVDRVQAELQGLGPLQELALLPGISDILVNGPDRVWVDSGHGLELTGLRFSSDAEVQGLAARLIAAGGRRLDDSNPCVDVQLRGYRVHAVLRPVSTGSTLLSIRIRRTLTFTLSELQAGGTLDPESAAVLRRIIACRLNFLISGATGTGKTTLLSTLLSLSKPHERLVLVEDAAELDPRHPHVVGLQSRHGNVEGAGTVDQAELVRQALRMRPDRLIVGECRGAEVRELLAAMNTGHDGAGGTIHANSAASVPARLAALGALAGMSSAAVNLQAASALDVVVHLARDTAGRRVAEIAVITASADGRLLAVPALLPLLPPGAAGRHGEGWAALQRRIGADQAPETSAS